MNRVYFKITLLWSGYVYFLSTKCFNELLISLTSFPKAWKLRKLICLIFYGTGLIMTEFKRHIILISFQRINDHLLVM